MSSSGAPPNKNDYPAEAVREQQQLPRNEHGQFAGFVAKTQDPEYVEGQGIGMRGQSQAKNDMGNMLRHIEQLEGKLTVKEKQLLDATQRVEKFSARTREGMQSALDSLMKKWMDACETKDEKCKEQFKHGMEKLVQNSAEENGVWQMMVAASSLHERQEHDLDKLRLENNELKHRIDGQYATSDARTRPDVLGKRKADGEPETGEDTAGMWASFASECAGF
jgi:hypothetical protein